ncbi:hypothetical protein PG985_005396 [Apiospora marii]|uniref:uncharacterized protein n=1 Tax=Apiospora marii TaxID=335849 RepID=UPI0031327E51
MMIWDPGAFHHHKYGLICRIERKERPTFSERLRLFWAKQTAKTSTSEKSAEECRGPSDQGHSWRISLAELQRMQLRKLQCKLVRAVVDMRYHDHDPPNWAQDLKSFVEAIKDYDYIVKRSKSPRDPFLVTGERKIDDYVMRTILDDSEEFDDKPLETIGVPAPWEEDSQPIGGTRLANVAQSALVDLKQRLAMAALGGALLVGPMWLMVKRNDLNTSLMSTTLFVVFFGLLMAAYLDKAKDVMSATAAYAAVLVVFVGLGTQAPLGGGSLTR